MKTAFLSFGVVVMLVLHSTSPLVADDHSLELARKAQAVFKANCYACHGQDGKNEGGLNYATELKTLVLRGKVVPGQPDKSRLYKRLVSVDDPMPPESEKQRPGKDDIAAIKRWIEAGAPNLEPAAAKRKFLAEADILDAILADLSKIAARQRRFMRYFTLAHLYNVGLSDDELQTYRHGLSKLLNSLSWGRKIVVPVAVDPGRTILRIDLRDYQWTADSWSEVLAVYPYAIPQTSARAKAVYSATADAMPYVRADWFVHAASQPPLYHDLLQLPRSEAELERLVRVDTAANVHGERVVRAGFNGSGVSRNNRLIERHESSYGAYWKSYDFAGNANRKNLFAHPLGPGNEEQHFQHDGGEIIFNLPNGLQGYLLSDARGNRLDKGPTAIVSDDRQPDRAVVNGVSCMSCHAKGMIAKADQVRRHVTNNPNAFDKETAATVLVLYPPKETLDRLFAEDAERFAKAVEKTGAHLSKTEPIVALASRFLQELDLSLAAAEAGTSVNDFLKGMGRSAELARQLGPLKSPGGTVQREAFAAAFPDIVRTFHGGQGDGTPEARLPRDLIASAGFNDARGINSNSKPGSPYPLDVANKAGGDGELGWAGTWGAAVDAIFQTKVVFEGDGALFLKGRPNFGPNYHRQLAEPQTQRFELEYQIQVPAGNSLVAYVWKGAKGGADSSGPNFSVQSGKFLVHPNIDTGFKCEHGRWHKVVVRVDVPDRTWELFVDDKQFRPGQPLSFRNPNAEFLDVINFLVEGGVFVDAMRVSRLPSATKRP